MVQSWWARTTIHVFWSRNFHIYDCYRLSYSSPSYIFLAKKDLVSFFLMAARNVIARHWRSLAAPTIAEWLSEITYTLYVWETCWFNVTIHFLHATWCIWIFYTNSFTPFTPDLRTQLH